MQPLRTALLLSLLLVSACSGSRVATTATTTTTTATTTTTSTTATTTTATSTTTVAAAQNSIVTPDGRMRTFHVYVPDSLPDGPVPLVVALHGGTGSSRQFERSSGFDAQADEHGFIVVYPDGVGAGADETQLRTWNAGGCCGPAVRKDVDDVGFIRALIDVMEDRYSIDPAQVFAVGHSNGGFMSYRLACELSDRIVAVGLQAGGLMIDTCSPERPVSLLHIHGAEDTNVPLEGGVGSGIAGVEFPPVADSIATMRATGATVELLVVEGRDHKWMPDAASTIVDFLFAH
ncbi:MAG: alpha/beta fold hydrolase [Actinobacteria bacterium]|nr:alpha/beta fold hydrolase [Actinomycetota bacterium]